jgi:cytidyltransferase-like protein
MKQKIILFGGSFDPIHNGHIQVACAAANEIGSERVILSRPDVHRLKKSYHLPIKGKGLR